MQQATVLKKNQVRISGAVNISQPSMQPANGPCARVIRQGPDETIIEITCDCGKTVNLRCEHKAK
jgi:hypothetical protein